MTILDKIDEYLIESDVTASHEGTKWHKHLTEHGFKHEKAEKNAGEIEHTYRHSSGHHIHVYAHPKTHSMSAGRSGGDTHGGWTHWSSKWNDRKGKGASSTALKQHLEKHFPKGKKANESLDELDSFNRRDKELSAATFKVMRRDSMKLGGKLKGDPENYTCPECYAKTPWRKFKLSGGHCSNCGVKK